ncbi:ABC transporter permease subunit [Aeromonas jandaei]|uniref:ABC transporter permease n=1 Tax=Aeromonas jandaei TaxID=650 RepID=UPI000F53DBEF|nr:ABC transporter permease subunit [Aeromonas jandaei]RQM77703.1 ABC transporter permease subunit [Aeromonas jandaei]
MNPVTLKKLKRFKSIKRGYYSFILFTLLVLVSLLAEILVNSRALVVSYQGTLYFPTYSAVIPGRHFGFDYDYETNYRQLKSRFAHEQKGDWVLLPPVPWNPYEQDFKEDAYPPYAPSLADRHFFGTDTGGRDVLARLVYGFRIAIGFAFIALVASYAIGVTIGCLMGFLGGRFDLILQRFIEIWSQVPFLYVIMILVSLTKPDFSLFVAINVLFGWMGITWYMRTLTYKERARDYVMAARAQGASTGRIIFHHILPNTLMMIVTLAPFSVVGNISTLTALDYLGFGLAPPTPSWGELLSQGINNLDAIWIVSSVVAAVSLVLIMVSFIGEAIREAFDPRPFTRYQ